MANERLIDHIDYEGESYEFADGFLRSRFNEINVNVAEFSKGFTTRIGAEETRAKEAEDNLLRTKADKSEVKDIVGFTDEDRERLNNVKVFGGATDTANGTRGIVPAPGITERGMFLKGDGSWGVPKDTTYQEATYSQAGLMSATDKINLDYFNEYVDEDHSSTIDFESNKITIKFGRLVNGVIPNPVKSREITFNADGTIREQIKVGAITQRTIDTRIVDGRVVKEKVD